MRGKITLITVPLILGGLFLVLLQDSGAGEKLLLVYFLVISDSGIRTCLHLCSRFVGEERGVHTQVKAKPLSRPSLLSFPSLTVLTEAGWELGSKAGFKHTSML